MKNVPNSPTTIHVVLHNRCNLKCIMCPYHSNKACTSHTTDFFNEPSFMNEDIWHKIVDFAVSTGVTLQIGQIEEPLMHPMIFDFVKYAKDSGIRFIHMTTNGILLTEDVIEKLCNIGIDSIMVSIDAYKPETYKLIRGGNLEKINKSAEDLIRIGNKYRIRTMVSLVKVKENKEERDDFIKFWGSNGIKAISFYINSSYDSSSMKVIRNGTVYQQGDRYPCGSPWTIMFILPDGKVTTCCTSLFELGWRITTVGDMTESSLYDIWHGDSYTKLRQELTDNKFDDFVMCRNCEIWSSSEYKTEGKNGYRRMYNETTEVFYF